MSTIDKLLQSFIADALFPKMLLSVCSAMYCTMISNHSAYVKRKEEEHLCECGDEGQSNVR